MTTLTAPQHAAIQSKPVNLFFAVFNCHVNNAQTLANKAFKERYGKLVFNKQIAPFARKGIMSIFDEPPNEWTQFWAEKVAELVNGEPWSVTAARFEAERNAEEQSAP